MTYLLLCILSSTGIFVVFKILDRKKIPSFPVIIINYLVASFIGFVLNTDTLHFSDLLQEAWLPISVFIGFLFIVMFFVIAKSSKEAGLSITTVASKMSVVFPIAFSLLIDVNDSLTLLKTIAILTAMSGVFLTIYQPTSIKLNKNRFFIPLVLFVGMGIVDSLVKFAQHEYVHSADTAMFSAVLFAMAFLSGIVILPFRKQGLNEFKRRATWAMGLVLGIVNFGSVYLMISALNHVNDKGVQIDSSVIFGINNIGIVSLSVLTGMLLFKEKLNTINRVGILISILAILMFSFS